MKITKTEFNMKVNVSSSWIIYISKTYEQASAVQEMLKPQKEMLKSNGWYFSVQTVKVCKDCRVPSFFHDAGYFMTVVEHNNGDWSKPATYELNIVE